METNASKKSSSNLEAYFLPYLTPSHYLPLFQMAKLFASRGVRVTFLSTPHNALSFRDSVDQLGLDIEIEYVDFPSKEVGLPEGVESFSTATNLEMAGKVFRAFFMLQAPMEAKVRAAKPDFIVADMHCFWATDLAAQLRIPRFIYHVRAYFALSAVEAIDRHSPHQDVKSDDEPFLIPGLPQPIYMTRSELPQWIQTPSAYTTFHNKVSEADRNCYGALVDSFYALEKDYIDYYRTTLGRRAWSLGPLFLHHDVVFPKKEDLDGVQHHHPCLEWLDEMPQGKVVYVSFGSLSRFSSSQLFEIASALESSGYPFIWVVRKNEEEKKEEGEDDDKVIKWLPQGFEERIAEKKKGVLMVNEWAPQAKILKHPSVGGFVTHCGWNSSMEAITEGLPVVAWPLSAEQFYHRRLFVDVLKTGVGVGNMKWSSMIEGSNELVEREKIEKAIKELMGDDEEAKERRLRAKDFAIAAKKAVQQGGSSYHDLTQVIQQLECLKLKQLDLTELSN